MAGRAGRRSGRLPTAKQVEAGAAKKLGEPLPPAQEGRDSQMRKLSLEQIERGIKKTKENAGVKKWTKDSLVACVALRRFKSPSDVDTAFRATPRHSDDTGKESLVRMLAAVAGAPIVMAVRPQPAPAGAPPPRVPPPVPLHAAEAPLPLEASARIGDTTWRTNVKMALKGGRGHRSAPAATVPS